MPPSDSEVVKTWADGGSVMVKAINAFGEVEAGELQEALVQARRDTL